MNTTIYERTAPGIYQFSATSQSGWISKTGGIWEIQVDKIGYDGKIIRGCRAGYGRTFAEAKQKVESMYN